MPEAVRNGGGEKGENMDNLYQEIELQVARLLDYLMAASDAEDSRQTGELHRQILQALDARMELLYGDTETEYINASKVTIHVQDEAAGRIYSRLLPLTYRENNNGLVLSGENVSGEPSEIVFFSETAVDKVSDITGHGEDHSPCKSHELHEL